jgi:thiosulfate/3-mercaptopyruvate sulfurtransferase
VADKAYVSAIIHSDGHEIVDARPAARFSGEEPDPRPGMASGHIPGSRSLPQTEMFNPDHSWKSPEEIRAAFDRAGVDLSKPMVTTCGSGVTAAVLLFAAELIGKRDVKLYDGSWTDWGGDPATPKATGAA